MKRDQRPEIGYQRRKAARKRPIFSASVLISDLGSLFSFHPLLHTFQELLRVESRSQLANAQSAMRQRFVTSPPRLNQHRVTTRHGFPWRLSAFWLKRPAPQHRLRITQIPLNQQLPLL